MTLNRLLAGVVAGLAVPTLALGAAMTSQQYSAAKDNANAAYKSAKAQCDSMSGNAKDVCVAEAKANLKKAKANAEAEYKNTDKARRDAKIDAAEADYDVAKAKCDAKNGNDKDVCVKEAKAVETKAKADAKANEKVAAAKEDAREDKMNADYKVAVEKCDAMSGAAKDSCVSEAKARYRK
jgi:cytoskeletal protein RodZ